MKKYLLALLGLFLGVLTIAGCQIQPENNEQNGQASMPNPASVYCEEQGGTLRMVETKEGTQGICVLPDGTECDEWAYYRGECPATQGCPEDAKICPDGSVVVRDPDNNCEFPECPESECAKEGESFSWIFTDEYPEHCCEGLTEWQGGMDTRVSIGDECYATGLVSGNPVGTCINCGNGICEEIENVCNCPDDCTAKSDTAHHSFASVAEFCEFENKYTAYCKNLGTTEESELSEICSSCQKRTFCTPEQRNAEACTLEYKPVCGWYSEEVQCVTYPCAETYSNQCMACSDEKVEYWTEGECHDS